MSVPFPFGLPLLFSPRIGALGRALSARWRRFERGALFAVVHQFKESRNGPYFGELAAIIALGGLAGSTLQARREAEADQRRRDEADDSFADLVSRTISQLPAFAPSLI